MTRTPNRRRTTVSRSTTFPQMTKLRSYKKKCVCEKKTEAVKKFMLLSLKDSETFVDKTLTSSDHTEFKVHGLVMASLSPTFSTMMKCSMVNTFIPYQKEVVEAFIKLAYTGTCQVMEAFVENILDAAKEYEIEHLTKICGDFLISVLSQSNALDIYQLSVKHCCEHTSSTICKFISKNFKSFIMTGEALSFSFEQVLMFMQHVDLQMKETELNQFAMAWAKANTVTIAQMDAVMHYIPMKRRPASVFLAIGGWSFNPTNVMETYDNLTDTWSISSIKLPMNSAYHGAVELDGKIYIAGGFDGENYLDSLLCLDLSTMIWEEKSPMLTKRCYIATVTLNGKIFAIGGHDGTNRLKTVEMYDPSMNMWVEMPSMKQMRSDFGVTVCEGKIFALGGFDGQHVLSSVEYLCPVEGKWMDSSPLSVPRSGATAMVVDKRVFVLGGYNGVERLSSVECFEPGITRTLWYQVQDMLHRRSNFAAFVMEGMLAVVGGYKKDIILVDGEVCGDVESYCMKENVWRELSSLQVSRSALSCVVVADQQSIV